MCVYVYMLSSPLNCKVFEVRDYFLPLFLSPGKDESYESEMMSSLLSWITRKMVFHSEFWGKEQEGKLRQKITNSILDMLSLRCLCD